MNANHARPMVAYCMVALMATLVTVVGLHGNPGEVATPGGSPSAAPSSRSAELVLGGQPETHPTPRASGLVSGLVSGLASGFLGSAAWNSLVAREYPGPVTGSTGPVTRATVAAPKTPAPTHTSVGTPSTAPATAVASPRHPAGGSGSTTTATATTTPTDTGHGNGNGKAHDGGKDDLHAPADPRPDAGR